MSTALLNPYCTIKDVQTETSNSEADDQLQFIEEINWASRWIDDYCRRDFLPHNCATVPLRVASGWCAENVIYLPMPVISLAKIVVDGTELASTDYSFENSVPRSTSRITRVERWARQQTYSGSNRAFVLPPKIELYGVFGFTPETSNPAAKPCVDLPQEIRTVCRVLAAIRSGKVKREFVAPDGSRQVATVRNLPADIRDSLNRYRQSVI